MTCQFNKVQSPTHQVTYPEVAAAAEEPAAAEEAPAAVGPAESTAELLTHEELVPA
jgi:hypothetical protein